MILVISYYTVQLQNNLHIFVILNIIEHQTRIKKLVPTRYNFLLETTLKVRNWKKFSTIKLVNKNNKNIIVKPIAPFKSKKVLKCYNKILF